LHWPKKGGDAFFFYLNHCTAAMMQVKLLNPGLLPSIVLSIMPLILTFVLKTLSSGLENLCILA
jgi:hypothetical protein